jgi:hypothetical protein
VNAPPDLMEVADRLAKLSRELDRATTAAEDLDYDAARKRHTYDLAFSRAFLNSTGSVDARKHHAVIETEHEKLDAEIAEVALRACRTRISTLKMQIETGRSLSAAIRAEISLANAGHTP